MAALSVAEGCGASQCGWPPMGGLSSPGSSVPCHVIRLFTMCCACVRGSMCGGGRDGFSSFVVILFYAFIVKHFVLHPLCMKSAI